jgi:hypothetical protein
MHDEMKTEAMELCVTACEKFSANNEVISIYNCNSYWRKKPKMFSILLKGSG